MRSWLVTLLTVTPVLAQTATTMPASTPATAGTQPAEDPNRVVLRVGEDTVTAAQFSDLLAQLPPAYQQGPGRRMLAERLMQMKLLAQQARKEHLDQTPQVQRQMEIMRDQVLAGAMAEKAQKSVDEPALRKYYEEHKTDLDRVTARHILVRGANSPVPLVEGKKDLTDEQAKAKADELKARLAKGEDFAAVAKAESDDPGSGARGGDLGTFGRGQMVPAFDATAFSLKEGEVSQPVKTQFGYHLIQVQKHLSPSFEEAKDELNQKMGPAALQTLLEKLKANTKTEMDEKFFGPAATEPMMP